MISVRIIHFCVVERDCKMTFHHGFKSRYAARKKVKELKELPGSAGIEIRYFDWSKIARSK